MKYLKKLISVICFHWRRNFGKPVIHNKPVDPLLAKLVAEHGARKGMIAYKCFKQMRGIK